MLAQIFLNKKPTFWPGGLSVPAPVPITMDASTREQHGAEFAWSDSPLENGQRTTDHGIELPQQVTLEVVTTTHTDTLVPNLQATRHIRTYKQLLALSRLREPFDLVTSLDIYTNMVFKSIGAPRTKENTNALFITCTLRKIEIATVDIAQNLADAALEIALGEQDIGAIAASAETAVPA